MPDGNGAPGTPGGELHGNGAPDTPGGALDTPGGAPDTPGAPYNPGAYGAPDCFLLGGFYTFLCTYTQRT